jgi:glutaredoxin 3
VSKVEIYTTFGCPYCDRARGLLELKNVPYVEHHLDDLSDEELNRQMQELSGQRTVPQVVINGQPIGGWSDLSQLERLGELDRLLGAGGSR